MQDQISSTKDQHGGGGTVTPPNTSSARRREPKPAAVNLNALHTMQANGPHGTGPELALRRAIRQAGLRGYRLNLQGIPGKPDVAFTRFKLAIFVHGCF